MDTYFWLSEAQFARLQPLVPTDTRSSAPVDDRFVRGACKAKPDTGRVSRTWEITVSAHSSAPLEYDTICSLCLHEAV